MKNSLSERDKCPPLGKSLGSASKTRGSCPEGKRILGKGTQESGRATVTLSTSSSPGQVFSHLLLSQHNTGWSFLPWALTFFCSSFSPPSPVHPLLSALPPTTLSQFSLSTSSFLLSHENSVPSHWP